MWKVFAFAVALFVPALTQGEDSPPNIILVMADDLGYGDVEYNGNPVLKTPCLNALAEEGLQLDRFYAAAPVCSPTRASCLTGRHPYRYGIEWAGETPLKFEEVTLAETLKAAGYATGHFGKWHVGGLSKTVKQSYFKGAVDPATYSPPWENGFDVSFSTESMMPTYNPYYHVGGGFDEDDYRFVQKEAVAKGQCEGGFRWRDHYWTGAGRFVDEWLEGDDSEIIMDRALPFIRRCGQAKKPFLALVWFHTPHTPVVAGNEDRARYPDQEMQEQHWYGAISAMDRQVGRLRDELRKAGLANNTIVWFCSDNGPSYIHDINSSGGLRGKKATLWEGGIRVPGIVEWPAGLPGGKRITAPISTSDFYPTLLAAAGVELPAQQPVLDGLNVLPLLKGEQEERGAPIAFQAPLKRTDNPFAQEGSLQMALIGDRYKLTSFDGGQRYQLFDLVRDAAETTDVAGDHPDRVKEMSVHINKWIKSCAASDRGEDYPEQK